MKVAGYVRVSTEQQKEEDSHKRQRDRLNEWVDRNGHELVAPGVDGEFYEDIAISGQSNERPEYETMFDNLDEFDAVAVRELSRFGRSLKQVLQDIETLQDQGVEFISVTESFDTSDAMGKAFMQMVGVFNEFWANLARERAMENIERRREQGEPVGRPKKLDESQIDQVREWRDKGLSYGMIETLVSEKYGVTVSRQSIYRYCSEGSDD